MKKADVLGCQLFLCRTSESKVCKVKSDELGLWVDAEGKQKDIQCKELRIDKDDDFSRLILTTKENTIGSITIEKDEI